MKKNNKIWIFVFGIALLFVTVFTQGFGFFNAGETDLIPDNEEFVTIPLTEVSENAKWYEYNGSRFFVIKADDGTIKTAFDACDVCYGAGKGYRQEGNYMICNNCGLQFAISGLGIENRTPGGCWPSYLPNIIEGDNLIIRESDLKNNQWNGTQGAEQECDPITGVCFIL